MTERRPLDTYFDTDKWVAIAAIAVALFVCATAFVECLRGSSTPAIEPPSPTAFVISRPEEAVDPVAAEVNRLPWEEDADGEFAPIAYGAAAPRGHEWTRAANDFRKLNPTCAACGCSQNIAIHHVKPWRLCTGSEEWKRTDPSNLISLCACREPAHNCHWREGHLSLSWRAANPSVREDSARFLKARQAAKLALEREKDPDAGDPEECR